MIPTIETIVADLLAGTITKEQAIAWLNQHAEGADQELRDCFAMQAMQGVIVTCAADTRLPGQSHAEYFARLAYEQADAMLKERRK